MQPELDHDHAFVGQRPLELDDLPVGAPPLLLGGESFDPFDQDAAVPGPVKHRHASPARQRRPEPPQEVVAFLVIAGRAELGDPDVPRVQRRHEPFDRTALAGGVPPLENHADRRPELRIVPDQAAQHQPQLQQPALSRGQAGRFLIRGELQAEIQLREHAALASHTPRLPSSTTLPTQVEPSTDLPGFEFGENSNEVLSSNRPHSTARAWPDGQSAVAERVRVVQHRIPSLLSGDNGAGEGEVVVPVPSPGRRSRRV